ncbi:MAG: hypothetical protein HGA44_01880 [Cellulomonadaceae bacterium]|nr:hypothetical protein [Cellulomonadaceae bacterium]
MHLEVDGADRDELMRQAKREGAPLTIARDQVAVAVLMSWPDYRVLRERFGRFEVAHWAAWTDDGRFDTHGLRQTVADLVEERRLAQRQVDPAREPSAKVERGDA